MGSEELKVSVSCLLYFGRTLKKRVFFLEIVRFVFGVKVEEDFRYVF